MPATPAMPAMRAKPGPWALAAALAALVLAIAWIALRSRRAPLAELPRAEIPEKKTVRFAPDVEVRLYSPADAPAGT